MEGKQLRVIFDCNVYLQALISAGGPAAACLDSARGGRVTLFYSDFVLAELRDVALRPGLVKRFAITAEAVEAVVEIITKCGIGLADVPSVFQYDRDPTDARYVDLALAATARLIVSRDKDLLSLNDPGTPEREALRQLGYELEVLTPVGLLDRIAGTE